ncbi:MAG: ATP-binding cassette domain-containing protein, partial [Streptosporangiaceae bacterium]
ARMGDILDTPPENDRSDLTRVHEIRGSMALLDVGFTYTGSSRPVLSHLDLSVEPGEFIAILGESGSGKSTLAMLLAGLYLPTVGEVLVDGMSIKDIDRASLRGVMSFVNQDTRLFSASIRDNIIWGTDGVAYENIKAAAKIACVHDVIKVMPMGYETLLGNGGSGLSGGQLQRVALARALVRKPKLLILDEATSALDPLLEAQVFTNMAGLDCTMVVIAHRLTKLETADRIIVLNAGEIVQQGPYKALQQEGGLFAGLSKGRPWSPAWSSTGDRRSAE